MPKGNRVGSKAAVVKRSKSKKRSGFLGTPKWRKDEERKRPKSTSEITFVPDCDVGSESDCSEKPLPKGWFPYDRKRSQTIADPKSQIADDRTESCFHIIADDRRADCCINFGQRNCQNCTRVVLAGKSQQTIWRTSRSKFCCKQIYFFFQSTYFEIPLALHLAPIQKVAFSIASDNNHTQFLCCGI